MSWTYKQSSGEMISAEGDRWVGYSGTRQGRNNPSMQMVHDVGPIPVGAYTIGEAFDDGHLGPCVMALMPADGNEMFGRSDFYIHGDNSQHDASHGCIILGPTARREISDSVDRVLVVES